MVSFIYYSVVFAQVENEIELSESGLGDMSDTSDKNSKPIIHKFYPGEGFRFSSPEGSYLMLLTGYLQASFQNHQYPDADESYSRWRIRRIRTRLSGYAFKDKLRYRIGVDMLKGSETESDEGNNMLIDAWVAYRPFGNNKLSISFGQRMPMYENRENYMATASLPLSERSRLSSYFGTIREVGFYVEGTYKVAKNSYIRPTLVVTDGDGAFTNTQQRYGGLKYGGRLNYYPMGLFRDGGDFYFGDKAYEVAPKIALGVSYSYNVGTSDRRGGDKSGRYLYQDKNGDITLPDFSRFNADIFLKYRGWNFLAEFTKTWAYIPNEIAIRVRTDGTTTPSFLVDGSQDIQAYIKNRMILGEAFNIQGGYLFRNFWTLNARFTYIKPDKNSYLNNNLYYGRSHIYEFSVAKYLSNNYSTKVQFTTSFFKPRGVGQYVGGGTFTGYETVFNILTQISF